MTGIDILREEIAVFLRNRSSHSHWPKSIRDQFSKLLVERGTSVAKLSREVGLDAKVVYGWQRRKQRPSHPPKKIPREVQVFEVEPKEDLFRFFLQYKRLKIEIVTR